MKESAFKHNFLSVMLLISVCMFVSCGGESQAPQPEVEQRLQTLSIYYGHYARGHRGKGPTNEKEFKAYITSENAKDGAPAKVDLVDELFISPRDNQAFVVNYGAGLGIPGTSDSPVIAYERTGESGTHYVVRGAGELEAVDEARLKEMTGQ